MSVSSVPVASPPPPAYQNGPVGIGGWLLLPIGAIAFTMLFAGLSFYGAYANLHAIGMVLAQEQLRPFLLPTVLSLLGRTLIFGSAAIALYLILGRHAWAPRAAIAHFAISVVFGFVEVWGDLTVAQLLPHRVPSAAVQQSALRAVVAAAIFVPYFSLSKRVRNTFRVEARSH